MGPDIWPGWTTSWARPVRLAMAGESDPPRPGESARPVPRVREETRRRAGDVGSGSGAQKTPANEAQGSEEEMSQVERKSEPGRSVRSVLIWRRAWRSEGLRLKVGCWATLIHGDERTKRRTRKEGGGED
eukprot:TRINITY_DN13255_c1_g1_i5.p1 TRINITY_DN13255_c1_g1~~TRINITY_DN13255_c1_g1_i5.p1  ORF type:complete len:130 (-),score=22.88 TRINITY_DN13255_c1_g1_i5:364-753(-)